MLISEDRKALLPAELTRAAEVRLTQDLYVQARQRGASLTGILEEIDPSTPDSVLDAFERQLAVAGIKIAGPDSDIIDRFFASSESSILFPEYVSRSVRVGMDSFTKLTEIVAVRTQIDDDTYKTIYMDDSVLSSGEKQLARVGEGAALPKLELQTAEHSIVIYKYGRYLEASYEAIRRKRASVVAVFLRAIGTQLQQDKFEDAVGVLINGDGNSNAASIDTTTTDDTLTYDDLVSFSLNFAPYRMNVMIANKATAKKILTLTEFKDPAVALSFQTAGEPITPFGATLLIDEAVGNNLIVGLDKRYALEEVYETGLLTESERLIRQQLEGTAISEVAGFGKLIKSACRVLDIDWA
jgi:hypothetical protein